MSSSPFAVAVCTIVSQSWIVLTMVNLLKLFVRFIVTEEAQMLIMGKHEVPVASVPVGSIATGNEACR